MGIQEGPSVKSIEQKLGYESEGLSTVASVFAVILLFAIAFSVVTFSKADFFSIMVSFIAVFFGTIGLMSAAQSLRVDAQDFVKAFREDNPQEAEIEILHAGYSKARKVVKSSLEAAIMAWLVFGGYAGIIEIAAFEGMVTINNWIMLGILHFLSFVSFVLAIALYLRKRSIEKALFAIQLKKSDKAEISIKL